VGKTFGIKRYRATRRTDNIHRISRFLRNVLKVVQLSEPQPSPKANLFVFGNEGVRAVGIMSGVMTGMNEEAGFNPASPCANDGRIGVSPFISSM
jgi:hypothetical protein